MKSDINLISFDEQTGEISFNIINKEISGTQALLQKITYYIYNVPTSNVFNNEIGSEFLNIVHSGYTPDKVDYIRESFLNIFSAIETQIINEQIDDESLQKNEKLKKLEIVSIEYNKLDFTWDVKVKVLTEANNSVIFTIWT
jgi:hypothetical protein